MWELGKVGLAVCHGRFGAEMCVSHTFAFGREELPAYSLRSFITYIVLFNDQYSLYIDPLHMPVIMTMSNNMSNNVHACGILMVV